MDDINDQIQAFFEAYEARFAAGLAGEEIGAETADAFAEFYVEASPVGIVGGKNDTQFQESVPKGYEFYRSASITKMETRQIDITELDDMHYLVDVRWESFYKKDEKEGSIEFSVIYFLQNRNNELKIFAYITGDEQGALREHGLI